MLFWCSESILLSVFLLLGIPRIQNTEYRIKISILQVSILSITFLLIFILLAPLKEFISMHWNEADVFEKSVKSGCINLCKIITATFGCILVFSLITSWTKGMKRISTFLSSISSLCFGVYLYHQFILKILWYKTNLPILVGPACLPILGCFITLILSIILFELTIKTKIGRFLIG